MPSPFLTRRALLSGAAAALALLSLAGCGSQKSETTGPSAPPGGTAPGAGAPLKVGIIPFESNLDSLQKAFQPFGAYLGAKTGRSGGVVSVTPSYAGTLQALQSDQIDCAYLNPLSYVLAVQQFKDTPEHLVPLAMPYFHKSLTYKGVVFVRADSGINSIKDLKGKSFAFADRTSTSGYLYPAGLMKEAGIDPNNPADIRAVNISGNAGVQAVLNKQADGGATYETGIQQAFTDAATKKVDQSRVSQFKVIATTDPIPNGMFVARGNLDPATLQKLQQALADINTDPQGKAALAAIPWDKMVPADDTIFNSVRQKATILGLKLDALDKK